MKRRTADGRERDPRGPPRSRGALRDGATVVGPGAVRGSTHERGTLEARPCARRARTTVNPKASPVTLKVC